VGEICSAGCGREYCGAVRLMQKNEIGTRTGPDVKKIGREKPMRACMISLCENFLFFKIAREDVWAGTRRGKKNCLSLAIDI